MSEKELSQPNPHDKKILKQIENLLGVKLDRAYKKKKFRREYVVNSSGSVVKLGLCKLGIDNHKLHALVEKLAFLMSLNELDLSSNQFTDISALKILTNLTEIELDFNELTDISALGSLMKLTTISLTQNLLTDISALGSLTDLTSLCLGMNQITDLSKIISLRKLKRLYLHNNQLSDLSPLTSLTSLCDLTLGENKLTDISALASLTNLTRLYLGGNELTNISVLTSLTNLTELSLTGIQLDDFSALSSLTSLSDLDLSDTQIADFSVIDSMKNLTRLRLIGNKLTHISFLTYLTSLYTLDLRNNRLTDISVLKKLPNLTQLDLGGNQLSDISVLRELTNLTRLDLRNNKLKNIPTELFKKDWKVHWEEDYTYNGMNLFGNPLESPPVEIIKKGRDSILVWFTAQKGEQKTLNEVKVLLVGDGGSGKTSLRKRLLGQEYNPEEPQTHGIRIEDWMFEYNDNEIKAHVWDFGGQDIMHATHQFFFTQRSLYVLLLNAREEPNPEDWLKLIESFGGDSPIMIVINKVDENRAFEINRKFLKEKYKTIRGIHRISCDSTEGIDVFINELQEELSKVDMINQIWAQSWLNIKHDLESLTEDYIDYKQYGRICSKHGIIEISVQNTLLNYLHELGVVLHFEELGLKDVQVLEPKWVTEAVYKILNSRTLSGSKGILCNNCLEEILNKETFADDAPLLMKKAKYTAIECGYILELMKKFELCYELDDERALVPDLLDVEESAFEFNDSKALQFYFQYDFLPRSVIPQFIVRMHRDIEGELRWRTGVVLCCHDYGCRAVVRADYEEGRIDIKVSGEQQRDYFSVIRYTIQALNKQFNKLNVSELILLPDYDEAVEYRELLGHWLDGRDEYYNGKLRKTFSVRQLLDGIEKPEARQMKEERHIHIERGDYIEKMNDRIGGNKTGDIIDSEVVFGNKIINLKYKKEYGLSPGDFREFVNAINELSNNQREQLKELSQNLLAAEKQEKKESLTNRIKERLISFGIGVAGSLTASGIWALAPLI